MRGERRKRFACTSLGTNPVAALTTIAVERHVRQVHVQVVLMFVDDHRERLGHDVSHSLDATVATEVVGACRDFPHA